MARKNTRAAQAAIDEAQAALAAAEDALGSAPANAYPETEDAPQGEPDASSIAEQTYAAIATYDQPQGDQPPPADIGPYPELTPGKTVTFTVADALTQLGTDAQFASSHAIHRTMIAVSYHDDGSVSVGSYVTPQERAHKFNRDDAGRMAVAQLRKV